MLRFYNLPAQGQIWAMQFSRRKQKILFQATSSPRAVCIIYHGLSGCISSVCSQPRWLPRRHSPHCPRAWGQLWPAGSHPAAPRAPAQPRSAPAHSAAIWWQAWEHLRGKGEMTTNAALSSERDWFKQLLLLAGSLAGRTTHREARSFQEEAPAVTGWF